MDHDGGQIVAKKNKKKTPPADRQKKYEYEFKWSVFFPWVKVKMRFDSKELHISRRKYFLGVIPLNQVELTFPFDNVEDMVPFAKLQLMELVTSFVFFMVHISIIASSFGYDTPLGLISIFLFSPLSFIGMYFLSTGLSFHLYILDKAKKRTRIALSRKEKDRLQEMLDTLQKTYEK
jgi:hypothetical protein